MKPTINFRCEPWEKELLERLAEKSRRTLSDEVKFLIEKALGCALKKLAEKQGIEFISRQAQNQKP